MVRISKLTDYAMVILAVFASNNRVEARLRAREIAEKTQISLPTVSKLLKILTKNEFLLSERGAQGGYRLRVSPDTISVANLIQALEGPIAITECNLEHDRCKTESLCTLRSPWQKINEILTKTLDSIKLSDLAPASFPMPTINPNNNPDINSASNPNLNHNSNPGINFSAMPIRSSLTKLEIAILE